MNKNINKNLKDLSEFSSFSNNILKKAEEIFKEEFENEWLSSQKIGPNDYYSYPDLVNNVKYNLPYGSYQEAPAELQNNYYNDVIRATNALCQYLEFNNKEMEAVMNGIKAFFLINVVVMKLKEFGKSIIIDHNVFRND